MYGQLAQLRQLCTARLAVVRRESGRGRVAGWCADDVRVRPVHRVALEHERIAL